MMYGEAVIPESKLEFDNKCVIRIGVLLDKKRNRICLAFEMENGERHMLPIANFQELEPMGLE